MSANTNMLYKKTEIDPVRHRFVLDNETKNKLYSMKPEFGFNGLGEFVFKRTYSRNNEKWVDVVVRVIEGVLSIRKDFFMKKSLGWNDSEWIDYSRDMAFSMFNMEWLPPGRGLWMMGTDFVYNHGSLSLVNCAAVTTKNDIVHAAEWCMDALMNGVGVGFDTEWSGTVSLPDKTDTYTYVVPDSREGWVDSLIRLMTSYIDSSMYGKNKYPLFDYTAIRKYGEPIKGFGGVASGYEPLKQLHERVEKFMINLYTGHVVVDGRTVPYNNTRFVADVFNSIGACVVAGNVRRSAEICLGNVHDSTFINLKNYEMNPDRIDIGWMSNNSVILKQNEDFDDFSYIPNMARRIADNGEPGMINLYNIQKYGRYGKEMSDDATLVNPCGEIPLSAGDGLNDIGGEVCNLAEVFPIRCKSPSEYYKALEYATFYTSTVTLLPTCRIETNKIVAKNRRIGVSISGIAQWASSSNISEEWGQMNYTRLTYFLRHGYKKVREVNTDLSHKAGVPRSIRVTTVKPSGSISLLTGSTPGVHYPVSRYAIRRVRIGKTSELIKPLIESGVPYEDDKYSDNTYVFSFVIDHGDVRPCNEVSPWEQFSLVSTLQRCYADNSVSATIYFDKEKDSRDIEKMLAMYIPVLKTVSMLPHSGHGYEQAPYEPITHEQYVDLLSKYKLPDFDSVLNNKPTGERFCSNDTCVM